MTKRRLNLLFLRHQQYLMLAGRVADRSSLFFVFCTFVVQNTFFITKARWHNSALAQKEDNTMPLTEKRH
jgi:hypothetical protein